MNYDLFDNATSSPGSASGRSPPAAPDGTTTRPYGLDPALASLSPRQAKAKGLLTSGTSGPHSTISSSNAALRSSLASRLREQTEMLGSTLYRLTWTQRVMPSGLRKPALRASERRTKGLATTGWPTASARDWKDTPGMATEATNPDGSDRTRLDQLPRVAYLAGWPTTSTMDSGNTGTAWEGRRERVRETAQNGNGFGLILPMAAQLAGWTTPQAHDTSPRGAGSREKSKRTGESGGACLAWDAMSATLPAECIGPARLTAFGEMLTGSSAGMNPYQSGGQLSPAHSLWLMLGPFATAWASCGERVTLSRSRKRKASSPPSEGA